MYAGQKNITARKIYNALETYVKDSNGKTYYWSNLKDANGNDVHFGVFVRINGIRIGDTFFSFLNEATGEYDKTLDEILSDATEIKISASYRLSEGSAWKDYADVTYTLKRNRIFILNRRLTEGDKNTQFDNGILLNPYDDTNFDPDDESAIIDLYSYQRDLLGEKRLSALFPGWLEDGELIPWMYHPAAGRHVIEPADMVPLWDNYTVQVKICWYDTDTGAVTRFQDDAADGLAVASLDETEPDLPVDAPQFSITQKFIYMQTLTGYEGDPGSVLEVPKYVQAVDMGTENTLHEVDYIKIPDTVRYVNTKNYSEQPEGTQTAVKGITVKKGYIVDADSTAYAATADGILTNADGSAYLGIPYDMTELTVPENVEKVTLRERNYVVPENVQSMFVDVCAHRLALRPQARVEGVAVKQVLAEIMTKIKPAHTEERGAMWKNRLAFALLYAALLVLLIAFSKPFLLAALIVLAVSAALMALLTRRDARLLRTSVRVKSGGREGETVPMTFTFAPKRRLLALAPVPAVLIVTGFRGYIAGGRAWLNAMLDRWNTVHEGGLALFSGTASERDVWAFALLAAVLIGLLTWYAVSRQSSRLAAFISVFWLLLSLFGEGFYPLALVLLTAGQLGLHMTSGSRVITRRAVAWCLEISAVLCACARWS